MSILIFVGGTVHVYYEFQCINNKDHTKPFSLTSKEKFNYFFQIWKNAFL